MKQHGVELHPLTAAIFAGLIFAAFATAQPAPAPQATPAQAPLLTPDQLDDLVAPVALYPDSLLSQILVASTYALEIVEAQQWLQQNGNLTGQALLDAAHQQDWAPSVQALVAFPDVLKLLNQDVQWTTSLGNAFLTQQADVMAAVQRMRAKAQQNGKLQSNSYDTVTTQNQNGQSAIVIQPANPQVIYVPTYNPFYVWGPPLYGYYPALGYPGIDVGFGWGPGIYVNAFFGGCCGWGAFGWGWAPSWFDHRILVNNYFLHRYGFGEFHRGFAPTSVWAHNPMHRGGVAYPNRALTNEFRGGAGFRGNFAAPRQNFNAAPQRSFGTPQFERGNPGGNHSVFGGIRGGTEQRFESDHGFSSMGRAAGGFHGGGGFRGGGGRGGGRRR